MTNEKTLRSLLQQTVTNSKVTPDIELDALEFLSYSG